MTVSLAFTCNHGRPTVYPMMQNTELQHDDTCNFYNPSFEFGHSNDGQLKKKKDMALSPRICYAMAAKREQWSSSKQGLRNNVRNLFCLHMKYLIICLPCFFGYH